MFDNAPIKREGQPVFDFVPNPEPEVHITYVERRVPAHLTHAVDLLIDNFLLDNGFNPKEI